MIDEKTFTYENPMFAGLKEPSREVSAAYGTANHFLDSLKEQIYIKFGMKYFAEIVHNLAHVQLERLDVVADLLHERHLMQFYPEIPELDIENECKEAEDAFPLIIKILDNVQEALEHFHEATDNGALRPMALKIEELQLANSNDYTAILEMASRFMVDRGSLTSFDSWCAKLLHGDFEEVAD